MPEANIPGMAFKARLTKREGNPVVELIFRGDVVTSVDLGANLSESVIETGLKMACKEADIEHQVPKALLGQVAGELYKNAGLAEGKSLVPQEFETGGDASALDRRLELIMGSLVKISQRLDRIESLLEAQLPQE
ncbi:MAG: hypothetical protein ACW97Z_10685 [Candidatus Hodarchaeales archaeon]|jgi:hypothetical protein